MGKNEEQRSRRKTMAERLKSVRSFGAVKPGFGGITSGDGIDFRSIQRIADFLPVMIAFFDRDLVCRFVNVSACEWFEKSRDEIIGHPIAKVIGTRAANNRRPLLQRALAGEHLKFTREFYHPTLRNGGEPH